MFGGPAGLQGIAHFVRLSSRQRVELTDPAVSLRHGLLELLDGAAMGGLAVTQFDLQLMDTVLGRLQLLDLGAEPVSVGQPFVELGDLFAQDADFFFQDFAGLFGGVRGLLGSVEFVYVDGGEGIEFTNAAVSLRHGLLQLLNGAAMGGLAVTQFDLQLMHATSHRLQLFYLGAKALSGGEAFIQLGDLFTQDADFFFLELAGLLGSLTGLLRTPEFVCLGRGAHIKLTNSLISFCEELLELLNSATMSGFPIAQFDFQQMDAILCRFQLLHADSDLIPVRQPFVELGDMFAQDPNFLLEDLAGLLCPVQFIRLGGDDRLQLAHLLLCRVFICFQVCHTLRPDGQFSFKRLDLFATRGQLSLG